MIYQNRVTRISVLPAGQPIFSEQCTHVTIDDEAGGEFLVITQQSGSTDVKEQQIQITPEEWPNIRGAIETLLKNISEWEKLPITETKP